MRRRRSLLDEWKLFCDTGELGGDDEAMMVDIGVGKGTLVGMEWG